MSIETRLNGLDGRTPLGFLASLGVQAAFPEDDAPTLHWQAHAGLAVVGGCSLDELAGRVVESYQELIAGPAVTGEWIVDDLKFDTRDEVREYLARARAAGGVGSAFAVAQVSEGASARDGRSKPSALHFTGGQMRFLQVARGIATGKRTGGGRADHPPLSTEAVRSALTIPGNSLSLLRWGETDGRTHALSSASPAERRELRHVKSLTNPALTALGLLGMTRYPTWTSNTNRCVTMGFFGRWPHTFVWPLWEQPAGSAVVASLLTQARPDPDAAIIEHYEAWGVATIWSAPVRRVDRYLSFGGARAAFQTAEPSASGPAAA